MLVLLMNAIGLIAGVLVYSVTRRRVPHWV